MSIEQILKVLKTEQECIKRQVDINKCKRHEHEGCLKCDLCLPDYEILEVYDFLINGYELLQNQGAESYTIRCKEPLSEEEKNKLLGLWGTCEAKATIVLDEADIFKLPDNMVVGMACTNCGDMVDKNNICPTCGYKLYDVTTGNDFMRQFKSMPQMEDYNPG